jgi:hypothetical protein
VVAILQGRGGASKGGRRIDNPPQVKNLPHNSSRRAENVMLIFYTLRGKVSVTY